MVCLPVCRSVYLPVHRRLTDDPYDNTPHNTLNRPPGFLFRPVHSLNHTISLSLCTRKSRFRIRWFFWRGTPSDVNRPERSHSLRTEQQRRKYPLAQSLWRRRGEEKLKEIFVTCLLTSSFLTCRCVDVVRRLIESRKRETSTLFFALVYFL